MCTPSRRGEIPPTTICLFVCLFVCLGLFYGLRVLGLRFLQIDVCFRVVERVVSDALRRRIRRRTLNLLRQTVAGSNPKLRNSLTGVSYGTKHEMVRPECSIS